MRWNTYKRFLKFVAVIVGGSIALLGAAVIFGDPQSATSASLQGVPIYDGVTDLISVFGQTGTGIGLVVAGIAIAIICYRAASRR